MKTSPMLSVCLVLLISACSDKDAGEAAGNGTSNKPANEDKANDTPTPKAPAAQPSSFQATVSGSETLDISGDMARAYVMAGFAHISLIANDRSMQIDFNTKSDKLPEVGTIALGGSNLRGWTATAEIGQGDAPVTYDASEGTLEIESIEDGIFKGTYSFKAKGDEGDTIEVKGTFSAREKKKK